MAAAAGMAAAVPEGDPGPGAAEGMMGEMWTKLQKLIGPMLPQMLAAGVVPPEANPLAMPEVYLDVDVNRIAEALAGLCRGEAVYRMDNSLVTIDERTGRTEVMSPARFVTWSGTRAKFYTETAKGKRYQSMTEQTAKLVLVSDQFRSRIREVAAVHRVRLPVFRDGQGTAWSEEQGARSGEQGVGPVVELLPIGYDERSRIYTIEAALEFREDVAIGDAVKWLRELMMDFPWGEAEQGMANQLAYMLSHFCRGMIAPAKCPIFAFMANLPGSGKGLLANMGIFPVYGKVKGQSLPETQELKKLLDMAAQVATPYLYFDNLPPGTLKSPLLEAWATMDEWTGRVIGTGLEFEMPAGAILILTGNGMKLGPDLDRRSLKIDLFAEETAAERPAPHNPLTENVMRGLKFRRQVLSCLWSLVRWAYSPEGMAHAAEHEMRLGRALESFEDWSAVVPLIVLRSGFSDPLTKVVLPDSGDVVGEDGRRTVLAALETMKDLRVGERRTISLAELIPLARKANAFVEQLDTIDNLCVKLDQLGDRGWKEQEWPDGTLRKPESERERREQAAHWIEPDRGGKHGNLSSLGYHMKKWAGRKVEWADGKGGRRKFHFGKRESSRLTTYEVTRLE